MTFKSRFLSPTYHHQTTKSATSSTSSSSSSQSSTHTKASATSSSSASSTSATQNSSLATSLSSLFHLPLRSRGGGPSLGPPSPGFSRTPSPSEWIHPPLKYSDPPQQEYVDMLAAWDWEGQGLGQEQQRSRSRQRQRRRQGSWDSNVSPGGSRRGSWI